MVRMVKVRDKEDMRIVGVEYWCRVWGEGGWEDLWDMRGEGM